VSIPFLLIVVLLVGFARQSSFFLLLSQKKETKEKATPYRFHPALLNSMGVNLKLASLKQSIADYSHAACVARQR
jgi:hypothetical protein